MLLAILSDWHLLACRSDRVCDLLTGWRLGGEFQLWHWDDVAESRCIKVLDGKEPRADLESHK